MKRWVMFAVAMLMLTLTTACDKNSSTEAPSTSQPAYSGMLNAPRAAIDAMPQAPAEPKARVVYHRGDCEIDIFPEGIGLTAGANLVLAAAHSLCKGEKPYDQTITLVIQSCSATVCSDGDWHDEPHTKVVESRLPPFWPDFLLLHTDTDCVPGVSYRFGVRVVGHDAMIIEGNPKPVQGPQFSVPIGAAALDTYVYGEPVTYSQSSCQGK